MSEQNFDLVVIGGGPGGYVAAIRAGQLGLSVACVEMRGALGGTCLNVGCIPSKALLQSSHHYEAAEKEFAHHGITVGKLELDLAAMMARKDKVVADLTKGIEFLFKKNKVTYIQGRGQIASADTVIVKTGDGDQTLKCENILIATGSDVAGLPGLDIDEDRIVSSTGALSLPDVPKDMVVIGGGVIGLELGSVWRRLGANVTVVEFLDSILPGMDGEIVKNMTRTLKKQGMKFKLATKVTGAKAGKSNVTITMEPRDGGDSETLTVDRVLVSVGRRPYTNDLGLENVSVQMDGRGFIQVDEDYQTGEAGIFAIGDVIGGAMLAHKAEEEGIACVEKIVGQAGHVDYAAIPGVVYTWPEVAAVGLTEEAAKAAGHTVNVGTFPFSANSRARSNGDSDGMVKIVADAATDRVLGCHIIGPAAGELIQEAVSVMEFGGAAEDIARTCHAHPCLSEAVKEAALAVGGRAIHS